MSLNSIKGLFSKENIKTGAGVVAATSVTRFALNKFGASLPGYATNGVVNPAAGLAYLVLIPGIAGILARRFDRSISDGLIIGGIANAAIAAINTYAPPATKAALGFSEYLDRPAMRGLGAPITGPGYGAIQAFGGGSQTSVLGSATPFKRSNW